MTSDDRFSKHAHRQAAIALRLRNYVSLLFRHDKLVSVFATHLGRDAELPSVTKRHFSSIFKSEVDGGRYMEH